MARGGGRPVALGLVAAVVAAFFVAGTSAQSGGCTTVIISLAPCLGFIQGNSSTPPSSCCTQLASVVQSQPRCLCQVLNGGTAPLGIAVNKTQALALPGACKVQTPPVSQCNAVGAGPASSPTEAPAPASPSTPTPSTPAPSSSETPSTPSTPASPSPAAAGSGSKATPSGQSSGGSSVKMTLSIFSGALFLASYASTAGIF